MEQQEKTWMQTLPSGRKLTITLDRDEAAASRARGETVVYDDRYSENPSFRIYDSYRIRKNSIKRMRYKLRRMRDDVTAGFKTPADCWPTVQSWCAHAAHANTWRLRCQLFSQPINQSTRKPQ